ncbi:MAG TPA: type II toxin-antitoxin system VapC family toxin [Polyangia bacterium]|nr:type II toxin-antitoxin system VapC family toxin [Polyangia bacterium]
MRFWDASAVVPLIVQEPNSDLVRQWLVEDDEVVLWALTRLEIASAIERRAREGRLSAAQRAAALRRMTAFAGLANEVTDVLSVRSKSLALLARHPVRATDAEQLGAALVVADPDPAALTMVVLDRQLADAAVREGLDVLTAP